MRCVSTSRVMSIPIVVSVIVEVCNTLSFVALRKMTKLNYLDLSHNKIRDITDLADIASRLVNTMDFSYNEIDYIPPEISQFYYELYYLYLNDNKLSYIPTDLFRLQYIRKADLQRNRFPIDEINAIKAKFKTAIPNGALLV